MLLDHLKRREKDRAWLKFQEEFQMLPESMREGSSLMTMPVPKCAFQVHRLRSSGTAKEFQGCGVRMGDWLVSPTHVINQRHLWIVHNDVAIREVEPREWREVATDVSAMRVTPEFANIKKAKISPFQGSPYVRVQAAMETQNASFGILKSAQAFGQTVYTGSTRAGFSGAVYVDVERVLALHQGGGAENYGMSAAFIWMRLQKLQRSPEDSSLAAIKNAFKKLRKREDWELEHTGNPGEFELRVGGQFFAVDNELMEEIYADEMLEDYFHYEESEDHTRRRKRPRRKNRKEDQEDLDEREPEAQDVGAMLLATERRILEGVHERLVGAVTHILDEVHLMLQEKHIRLSEEEVVEKQPEAAAPKGSEEFEDDEPPFLEKGSRRSSQSSGGSDIDCQQLDMQRIQNMLEEKTKGFSDGLHQLQEQFELRLSAMQTDEQKRMQALESRIAQNIEEQFGQLMQPILSRLDNHPNQAQQNLTSTSGESSVPSNQRAPSGSANSPGTQPSGRHLGGMESAILKYREWRTSNKPSSPNFVDLRKEFLRGLGLSTREQEIVVRNYSNWYRTKEARRIKRELAKEAIPASGRTT